MAMGLGLWRCSLIGRALAFEAGYVWVRVPAPLLFAVRPTGRPLAHNQLVVGSNPTAATTFDEPLGQSSLLGEHPCSTSSFAVP